MTDKLDDELEETELLISSTMTVSAKTHKLLSCDLDIRRSFTPEKKLLLAVLEMAVRDLLSNNYSYVAQADKRNAIAWIEETLTDPILPFSDITIALDIVSTQVNYLKNLAKNVKSKTTP